MFSVTKAKEDTKRKLCEEWFQDWLPGYLGARASSAASSDDSLNDHLAKCASCQTVVDDYELVEALVGELGVVLTEEELGTLLGGIRIGAPDELPALPPIIAIPPALMQPLLQLHEEWETKQVLRTLPYADAPVTATDPGSCTRPLSQSLGISGSAAPIHAARRERRARDAVKAGAQQITRVCVGCWRLTLVELSLARSVVLIAGILLASLGRRLFAVASNSRLRNWLNGNIALL